MFAKSASHNFAADSTKVSKTTCRSKVERLMTLSTSAVARCCWSVSSRSRLNRATFAFKSEEGGRGWRTAFGAMRLLRAPVLRRGALVGSPPPLDRRRIAAPRAQGEVSFSLAQLEGSGMVPRWAFQRLTNVAEPLDRCLKRGTDCR